MESESYDQMCAVVRQHHAHQCALDNTGEASGARRESILLAGLGNDLLGDTNIDCSALTAQFGEPVAALIFEVTNAAGDSHLGEYLDKLKTFSESALLIKLADLAENAMNASCAAHENGTENTRR